MGISLSNAEIRILDLVSSQFNPVNQEGMILVSSPSVFAGYPDTSIASPFVDQEGKVWYQTGDLGYMDAE